MSLSRAEQSRLNGAKSRGPKSEAGKARSAANAARHGLSGSRLVVLNNEDDEAFQQLFRAFLDKFQPQDEVEHECVLQAAVARWRLRRVWQLETALFDNQMDRQAEQLKAEYVSIDEGTRQAAAFQSMADNSNAFSLLNRYERTISREYERALKNLDRARAERASAQQTEPAPQPEIEKERNEPEREANLIRTPLPFPAPAHRDQASKTPADPRPPLPRAV